MSTLAHRIQPARELLSPSSISSKDEIGHILKRELDRLSVLVTWQKKTEAIDSVIDAFRKHQKPNWDGYGAVPLSEAACTEAILFLKKLPIAIPSPEVIPNPDGDLSLEWYMKKRALFVVTFSGKRLISYAGVFGAGSKLHGTEIFMDSVPSPIIENICRLLSLG